MIKSMTAFAEASHTLDTTRCDVEIRSYNSRHLDIALYLPRGHSRLEDPVKQQVAAKVARGRVEIRIALEETRPAADLFQVDSDRAKGYAHALNTLKKELGLADSVTLDQVLAGGRMIVETEPAPGEDRSAEAVRAVVEAALDQLDGMRCNEGEHLARDLAQRLDIMSDQVDQVAEEADAVPELYRQRLVERVARLTQGVTEIDADRLAQETAILADKSDIAEEIVRVRSHIRQFREILAGSEPGGRKLNFLVQEFNREFNTMGSKSGRTRLSHTIVDLKSELERIREQVQNIE